MGQPPWMDKYRLLILGFFPKDYFRPFDIIGDNLGSIGAFFRQSGTNLDHLGQIIVRSQTSCLNLLTKHPPVEPKCIMKLVVLQKTRQQDFVHVGSQVRISRVGWEAQLLYRLPSKVWGMVVAALPIG